MEEIKKKRIYNKKIKTEETSSELSLPVKSSNSLTNIIENEKNSYKYTKHGAIRQSWIRDEAKRERSGNNDLIALKVKEELLRLEQKKMKEDERDRLREEKKRETIRLREEKKQKIKSEKIDMRGKTEKALAHNKKQGSRLQESMRLKFLKKEEERRRKHDDSSSEEEEITIIKKKRSKSRTPDIDYRKYYEDSIKKKTIREEEETQRKIEIRRGESPNIDKIRDLQRNMFKGIL